MTCGSAPVSLVQEGKLAFIRINDFGAGIKVPVSSPTQLRSGASQRISIKIIT